MDTACEASAVAPLTTQENPPPSPNDHVHEDLLEGDDTSGTKDGLKEDKNSTFPPITQEMFENQFRQFINGEGDDQHKSRVFRGYSDKDENFLFQYTDKKSEIIYDFYKKAIANHKESMLKSANGRIPVPISSKSMKAYLISPKFLPKPLSNVPEKVNPAGRRDLKKMEVKKIKPNPQLTSDVLGNGDSSLTWAASPSTSPIPARAPRLIQTPRRYLGGEEERPKTVKRAPRRKAAYRESLFEMGLLHPKYPRKVETSSPGNGCIDNDVNVGNHQSCSIGSSGGANSMFAISNMLHSGELQYVINLHHLEMEHKEKLEQLELKLQRLPKPGISTPNKFELINESRHSNPSPHAHAMERSAPSSTNTLTIVPLKLIKKPQPPPPALVSNPRCSPESMIKSSGSLGGAMTITKAKPKAPLTSFKAAGNTKTTQGQGNVGNVSRNHLYPHLPMYSKILPKMANPVGILGPFPQPPVLTGKTFKKNSTQHKSPQQAIRQDNGLSQTRTSIPDFMMNFLGSNYALSSASESGRVLMTPPRSLSMSN